MYAIDFHADDYAASLENSKRILELMRAGRIDSCSVIANMGCFEECLELLRESWSSLPRKPLLSVHVNLIDGYRLSSRKERAVIRNSWTGLFFRSLIPGAGRKQLQAECSSEIEAQISAFLEKTADLRDDRGNPPDLRIDSHVHTHMIPLVFRALMDALDRMELRGKTRFIRCSLEPLSMFLYTPGITGSISPVNLAKNLMLRLLSRPVRRALFESGIETGRIFGLAMTGEMDEKRVRLLLPKMKRYAKRKGAYLEVLSHPGRTATEELAEEYGPDDRKAFPAPQRDMEYQMLVNLSRDDRES